MFKLGDWVVEKSDNTLKQIKLGVNEDEQRKLALYGRLCVKWEPKVGEWCWFRTEIYPYPELRRFKCIHTFKTGETVYMSMDAEYYEYCEPFIGELPSFFYGEVEDD